MPGQQPCLCGGSFLAQQIPVVTYQSGDISEWPARCLRPGYGVRAQPTFSCMADRDTIYALSSGRPPAAIAVVRVSGPQARDAITALAGRMPAPRQVMLARLRDRTARDTSSQPVDDALVLWF